MFDEGISNRKQARGRGRTRNEVYGKYVHTCMYVCVCVGCVERCSTFASAFDWKTAKPIHRLTSSSGHNSLKKHLRKWNNIRVYKTHAWLGRGGGGRGSEGKEYCHRTAVVAGDCWQQVAQTGCLVVSVLTHCCGVVSWLAFPLALPPHLSLPLFMPSTCFDSSRIRIHLFCVCVSVSVVCLHGVCNDRTWKSNENYSCGWPEQALVSGEE